VDSLGRCLICGQKSSVISDRLGVCLTCIRDKPEGTIGISDHVHAESRKFFSLPPKPPTDPKGVRCGMCANDCAISIGQKGFCGLVSNVTGHLVRMGGTPQKGVLEWYYDPLPTNCVAWWFCPGCTGAGYPRHAYASGPEHGYSNLAVFYGGCSLDCLFCQNWHYRHMSAKLTPVLTAEELASKADQHVSCICYFGGDPSVQMPHAIKTSQIALRTAAEKKRIIRICWETNGNLRKEFAQRAAELSFASGGVVKFDLKAWDDNLNRVLCGVSNRSTLKNFKMIGERYFKERPEVPILTASTLLVPGYIDIEEIEAIARFISEVDPAIPYTLLAFHPQYVMNDLPTTSRRQASECYETAKKYLEKVRIGNLHLLSTDSNYS